MTREEWAKRRRTRGWKVDTVWGGMEGDPVQHDIYELGDGMLISIPRKVNYGVRIKKPESDRWEDGNHG